jgi:hypothetical protein
MNITDNFHSLKLANACILIPNNSYMRINVYYKHINTLNKNINENPISILV